jgi:hypothetical protein
MAKEAGIKLPGALTATVWGEYVEVPEGVTAQDETGTRNDVPLCRRTPRAKVHPMKRERNQA